MQEVQSRGTAQENGGISAIRGVLLMVLGVLCFFFPAPALLSLALMLGMGLVATGCLAIYQAVKSRQTFAGWGMFLIWGLVEIVFGGFLIANPILTALSIPVVVGVWAIMSGIIQFTGSFTLKSRGVDSWWFSLLGGILAAAIGLILVANPIQGALIIPYWIGTLAILVGAFSLAWGSSWKQLQATAPIEFPTPEQRRDEAA